MKTIILVLGLMVGIINCEARIMPPGEVLNTFNQMYPGSKVRGWTEKDNNIWVATFKDDKSKDMAYFLRDGVWLKTETKIPAVKDLPMAVDMSWKNSGYDNWLVENMKKVKYPGKDLYIMEVQESCGPDIAASPADCEVPYNLYFNKNGALIKEVIAKNDVNRDMPDVDGDMPNAR